MVREDISDRLITNLIITIMKKILTVIVLLMLVGTMQAQRQVTKFLGIPVDGTKAEMTSKLIAKGFTLKAIGNTEFLEGEFNGAKVHLYIITHNNKVWRIMLCDAIPTDEDNIKIRYNTLIRQFEANNKYETIIAVPIDESVRLLNAMMEDHKIFEAAFNQKESTVTKDGEASDNDTHTEITRTVTATRILGPSIKERKEIDNATLSIGSEALKKIIQNQYQSPVWFRIVEGFGNYYITMYYDNKYNEANGEDL